MKRRANIIIHNCWQVSFNLFNECCMLPYWDTIYHSVHINLCNSICFSLLPFYLIQAQPYYSYQLRRKLTKVRREMRHNRTCTPKQNGEAITSKKMESKRPRWSALGYCKQDLDIPAFGNTCPISGTTVPIIGNPLPVLGSNIPIRETIDGEISIRLGQTIPF